MSDEPLLSVRDLRVGFVTEGGRVQAVDGVSFDLSPGEVLAIVGESGSGKSVTAQSILGLTRSPNARIEGSVRLDGAELLDASEAELRQYRGKRVGMVFQDSLASLNPVYRVGEQIVEAIRAHDPGGRTAARERALELMRLVRLPAADERFQQYPHQLSGGMRQRVMIAIALACDPLLLIADEPTTALDVTIQAQILELMAELQDRSGMAIQLISHNLGVVSEIADDIIVMYAGRIVERAAASELFANPRHPYTIGLIETLPSIEHRVARLPVIAGSVPDPARMFTSGCRFAARCPRAIPACREAEPPLVALAPGHLAACIRAAA